jgi:glucuronate isomerase
VLCDLVGQDAAGGELPQDESLLRRLIEDICYRNAQAYLHLPA